MTGIYLAVAVALSPVFAADAPAPQGETWDARVVAVAGDVQLNEAGKESPAGVTVEKGLPLQEGDRLKTGADGSVDVSFDGGSLIRVGPQSDFKLSNLHRSQTLFDLASGTFLGKIKKLQAAQTLQVRAPSAVAAVLGTEFGVECSEDGKQSFVGVFDEGKVQVKGSAGTEKLIGGQETAVGADGKPSSPYQLQRLARYRSTVRGFKGRVSKIGKAWKPLSAEERAKLRKDLLAKSRGNREKKQEQKQKEKGEKRKETDKVKKERAEMERARERARSRSKSQ